VHQDAQTDALVAELHAQLAQMRERLDDTIKQRDAWLLRVARLRIVGGRAREKNQNFYPRPLRPGFS
jgi:hypothetical protein